MLPALFASYGWESNGDGLSTHWPVQRLPVRPDDLQVELLAALEHPDRFAAAHLLLHRSSPAFGRAHNPVSSGPPWALAEDGLRVVLAVPRSADGRYGRVTPEADGVFFVVSLHDCPAEIDPGQLPVIREQWHRRLDVAAWSVPYGIPVAIFLVPTAWAVASAVGRRARRWSRRRRGRCGACGYDLTGNASGACPECGSRDDG